MSHSISHGVMTHHRRASQKGSALLIVLVFAAIIAIMLYREIPVVAFEAQRQKEALLMDRGNEYKRAVKLYVRKFQTFPPSIEALENTNRMRFLRARYVDPYTGKDDWRLLHAGPGGIIIDSKIKQAPGANGAAGLNASTLGAASSVTNPFANSFVGGNSPANGQTAGNNFPQRPPAMSTGGNNGSGSNDLFPAMPVPGGQQVDPQTIAGAANLPASAVPYPGYPGPPNNTASGQTGNSMTDPSLYGQANSTTGNSAAFPGGPGRYRAGNPTGNSFAPGQFGGDIPPTPGAQDPQSAMQSLLNTQNPQTPVQTSAFNNNSSPNGIGGQQQQQMGAMGGNTTGGGIAGVASKSTGHTIKILNDQTERSLWEFVYDMQKEALANAPNGGAIGPNGGTNPANQQNGSSSAQSNPFPSSFGQNSNIGNTLTTPQPQNQ